MTKNSDTNWIATIKSMRDNEVRENLREAMATLRSLPLQGRDRPKKIASAWVEFQQISFLSSSSYRKPVRPQATPEKISHMNSWLDAVLRLPDQHRRIVMARACGIPWRRLEEIDGRSHTTLRKVETLGLTMLRSGGGNWAEP